MARSALYRRYTSLGPITIQLNSSYSNKLKQLRRALGNQARETRKPIENPDAESVYLTLYRKQVLNLFKSASELYGVSWLMRLAFLSKERIDHQKGSESERKLFLVHQYDVNGVNHQRGS